MADDLRTRDIEAIGQVGEQAQQAVDLRGGERRGAVVVEFDADRCGVHVGDRAPAPGARVPGARAVIDELVNVAVGADQIM